MVRGDKQRTYRVRAGSARGVVVIRMSSELHFLWNPDFYYNKAPKPHSKLKQAQITLREKQLSYKLKLGGESDNPTSKGIPQPPLWRKSFRGVM